MQHWSQLATRNWRVKPVRALGALFAIALGTGAVVWVSCCYESVRETVMTWAGNYVGRSQIVIESPLGKYDHVAQRLATSISEIEGVKDVVPQLVQRLRALPVTKATYDATSKPFPWTEEAIEIDFHGIDLEREPLVRSHRITEGRALRADDEFACVMEDSFARERGVGVGDTLLIWSGARPDAWPMEIVGLVDRRRIARFQKGLTIVRLPTLQRIALKQALVTSLDVILDDSSRESVSRLAGKVRAAVTRVQANASVRTTEARMRQIETAQSQQEFILVLLSCVALLTALFIILSTLSMGMIERIRTLGLMRCIGLTGSQLAWLVLVEVVPLGVAGILAGIPIGLGLTQLTVWLVPDYVGQFTVSFDGILLASGAGFATTLVAAVIPAVAALRASPLEAAHPRARPPRVSLLLIAGAAAVLLLLAQNFGLVDRLARSLWFLQLSTWAIVLLYLGYALAAPLVVWIVSVPAVWLVATLLGVRPRLLQDQIGHAAWRSAGICCGLMVGLSMIVGLVVFNESFRGGWQFPKQFPEAYIWSFDQMQPDPDIVLPEIAGIRNYAAANAINVIVEERPAFMEQVLLSVTWFLGCDPDTFLELVRLEFREGDERTARELLKQGGYVLVAEDFARTRNKKLGDEIKVFLGQRVRTFKIAGVIQSPALDIAAGYFQAQSEANVVATGSVIGTNEDLERLFEARGTRLILMNFDLPPSPVPTGWQPPRVTASATELIDYDDDSAEPLQSKWQRFREEQVLREVRARMNAPAAYSGTVRELKDQIDRELTRMTGLLTAVPTVALLIAAIGVANLMTANVNSRSKQIAILRAVGATRGQVLRLVIGEALVLGVLGSALGFALGVHLAVNTTTMVDRMWGFRVSLEMPWNYVGIAVLLTVGLCIIAGVLPARHASRTNIVDALHVP